MKNCIGMCLILIASHPCWARDSSTKKLLSQGKLGIPYESCAEVESKLGQLFYVNVDGFKSANHVAIDPAYFQMVKDLQVGGVLPKSGNPNYSIMQADYAKLKSSTQLPLLVGVDAITLSAENENGNVGLGMGGGILRSVGKNSDLCLAAYSFLSAFLHKAVGLNQALGPTVERNASFEFLNQDADTVAAKVKVMIREFSNLGVVTTMKHFPYTPDSFNLHERSEDTKIPADQVMEMLRIYKELARATGFAMSTHLINSNIDPEDMATFSKKWIEILRHQLGFNGLLISDGLFMFDKYSDAKGMKFEESIQSMKSKWSQEQIPLSDDHAVFAARTILSGHDMVLLEGTRPQTYNVFNQVLYASCQNNPLSNELRDRILTSYDRIVRWKAVHAAELRQTVQVPEDLVRRALKLQKSVDYTNQCSSLDEIQALKSEVSRLGFLPLKEQPANLLREQP